MIYIITGAINGGKSTKLVSLFRTLGKGDGFYNQKIFTGSLYIGQEIVRLSDGTKEVFSLKKEYIPSDWDEQFKLDVYSFSRKGMLFAQQIIKEILDNGMNPVFIDEIGPLELQGRGFYDLFQLVLVQNRDVYVVVRKSCLMDVINKFYIHAFQVIPV